MPLAQFRFARALNNSGHNVCLAFGRVLPNCELKQSPGLETIVLDRPNVRSLLIPIIRLLLKERPDIVFSAEDHLNCIVILAAMIARSNSKISCSSRVTPYDTYSSTFLSKRWILKQIFKAVASRADVLTCVSKDMVSQYQTVFEDPPHQYAYNIVSDDFSISLMDEPVDHPWFNNSTTPLLVAAGRLAHWKGFDDLIDAFDLVAKQRSIRLAILGDGPLRKSLQNHIDRLGLTSSIQLLGYVTNPLKYFSRSDIFVLSSHVEGLPNVLVEAMMCGCTPVATDCPTGPREVLESGRFGYLVTPRNPQSLADGILNALDSRIHPDLLTQAIKPFRSDTVIQRHFDLLGLSEFAHIPPG